MIGYEGYGVVVTAQNVHIHIQLVFKYLSAN